MLDSLFIIYYSLFMFVAGTAIGSFINVLIDRLPNGQSIFGRSHCDCCQHTLAWYDLIPVVSFLWLKGKCRYCGKKLSWQYPMIEILTGVIFVLIFNFSFGFPQDRQFLNLLIHLGFASTLLVIFFADVKYQIIPDSMQTAFLIFSILLRLQEAPSFYHLSSIINYLLSGLVVMLPILLLFLLTRGRGMGFGDVKLAFNMGFLLGIFGGLLALYVSFIIGAVVGLIMLILKLKKLKSKIAFGPFLIIGTVVMLVWGDKIMETVRKVYGF